MAGMATNNIAVILGKNNNKKNALVDKWVEATLLYRVFASNELCE